MAELIPAVYADAVALAAKETKLAEASLPAQCPFSEAEMLDDGFLPESAAARAADD